LTAKRWRAVCAFAARVRAAERTESAADSRWFESATISWAAETAFTELW
jgi:hypothetical protein